MQNGNRPIGRPRRREILWGGTEWIHLAHDRDQWTRQWTFGFHKMLRISWVAERLAASQGLSSTNSVNYAASISDVISSSYHRQNSPIWAIAFLRRSCQIWSGFHFFGSRNDKFLHKVVSLACNPQPRAPDLCIYVPHWDGGAVIPPDIEFPFLSPSTTRRATMDVF
jgi:hypothetical protein